MISYDFAMISYVSAVASGGFVSRSSDFYSKRCVQSARPWFEHVGVLSLLNFWCPFGTHFGIFVSSWSLLDALWMHFTIELRAGATKVHQSAPKER